MKNIVVLIIFGVFVLISSCSSRHICNPYSKVNSCQGKYVNKCNKIKCRMLKYEKTTYGKSCCGGSKGM